MEELSRLALLIGNENVIKLTHKRVLVLGLGGVGGYVVEALCRSGIGSLVIADQDVVSISNLNRQLIALQSTIGKSKVAAWKERISDIIPSCQVTGIEQRITAENIEILFQKPIDFAIDACDTVTTKLAFLKYCICNHIPFVTCLGTGKRMDPTKIVITELGKTQNDPLAKVLRKLVKEEGIKEKIPVVYSTEIPIKIEGTTIGSSIFVPSCAGMTAASYAIKQLLEGE